MRPCFKEARVNPTFNIARLPRIEFGPGAFQKVASLAAGFGQRALIVTGAHSFLASPHWASLQTELSDKGVTWDLVQVAGEPSPELIDQAVRLYQGQRFDVVLGIGGGSALDAAKAIAGLLKPGNSVRDHLEGVGPELPYRGPATPFIAVPTTAGTGSEATKNAVLSVQGAEGFKKSFRDDKLVAEYAIVDPDLLATCPPGVLAANGMDAFTQLLESYVSTKANPFTDALALSGLEAARDGLLPWYEGTGDAADCRGRMAYAALLSGITLAQVGLGSVHGLASPLGAFFPIPHGVVCGTLVAAATQVNIAAIRQREPDNRALKKYADVGRLLRQEALADDAAITALLETLEDWTRRLELPRLSAYGIAQMDFGRVVANSRGSSMKTNPIVLTDSEIAQLLAARL
ncbi:MAG: iron-containing alcohol dehydrogenase [Hydrogenophilaceae bacterium]|nr:iron-containing alcohol dehydrogenase [Hydrogenophilaceae bacterium]